MAVSELPGRRTLTASVREALAPSASFALATTLRPRLSTNAPPSANACGFVTVTATFVPCLIAVGAIATFGPVVRISAYGSASC